MNILEFFPISVYVSKNTDLLEETNRVFDEYSSFFHGERNDFRTTLAGYSPARAKVTLDVIKLNLLPKLVSYIEDSVKNYLELQEYEHYNVEIVNMWLNEMNSSHEHKIHNHYGYSLSGCYYPLCPAGSNLIELISPYKKMFAHNLYKRKNSNRLNTDSCQLELEAGSIILFPSFINHGVPLQKFEGVRRSIAFDIILD